MPLARAVEAKEASETMEQSNVAVTSSVKATICRIAATSG